MPTRRALTVGRVLVIYLAGLLAGVQGAIYLFDGYDDGVADWRSGVMALALVLLGLALIARTFRRAPPG